MCRDLVSDEAGLYAEPSRTLCKAGLVEKPGTFSKLVLETPRLSLSAVLIRGVFV
jgi:hypothetical protein